MDLQDLLTVFLVWAIYPLWLAAGFLDYLLHRKTRIDKTSGPKESGFHLAEFISLAFPLVLVTFLQITPLVIVIVAVAIIVHTGLSIADATFTDGRRYISPLEQHAHAFMAVLPIVAAAIVALLNWQELFSSEWALRRKPDPIPLAATLMLVGSYFLLAGIPIVEELIRTSHGFRQHQVENDHQRREGDHP